MRRLRVRDAYGKGRKMGQACEQGGESGELSWGGGGRVAGGGCTGVTDRRAREGRAPAGVAGASACVNTPRAEGARLKVLRVEEEAFVRVVAEGSEAM